MGRFWGFQDQEEGAASLGGTTAPYQVSTLGRCRLNIQLQNLGQWMLGNSEVKATTNGEREGGDTHSNAQQQRSVSLRRYACKTRKLEPKEGHRPPNNRVTEVKRCEQFLIQLTHHASIAHPHRDH